MAAQERIVNGIHWKFIQVEVDLDNFLEIFKVHVLPMSLPDWNGKELSYKLFEDGITNKLVGLYLKDDSRDDMVLLRINGNNTEQFINRDLEIITMITLHKAGMNPPLYCQFINGLCYGFAPGRSITLEEMRDFKMGRRMAKTLAKLHSQPINSQYGQNARLDEFFGWLDNAPQQYDTPEKNKRYQEIYGGSTDPLRREITELKVELNDLQCPLVFCHNDLLAGNLIYNERNEMITLIDFEYGGPNARAYDIADYFCEFAGLDVQDIDYRRYPDMEFQKTWIRMYLEEAAIIEGKSPVDITEDQVHQLYRETNKFALAAHLMWAVWALIQAKYSTIDFDYIEYSGIRYDEYLTKKQTFLSL